MSAKSATMMEQVRLGIPASGCRRVPKAPNPDEDALGQVEWDEQNMRDELARSTGELPDATEDSTPDLVDLLKGRER